MKEFTKLPLYQAEDYILIFNRPNFDSISSYENQLYFFSKEKGQLLFSAYDSISKDKEEETRLLLSKRE